MFYEIMHRESCVAQLSTTGECRVCLEDFMPYDLVLVESDDFDERINNVTNFYYWCASRMLTLDRTYAKEILNSIGASQSVTDRERAQIALSYHCLSLLDVFWVKEENEKIRFEDINLFAHSLSSFMTSGEAMSTLMLFRIASYYFVFAASAAGTFAAQKHPENS